MTAPDTESGEPDLVKLLPDLMARYRAAAINPILARFYFALTGEARLVEDLLQECRQRSAGRESTIDDVSRRPATDPRHLLEARLQASIIVDALYALPAGQREVLMMIKVGDISVEVVVRATGSTAAAVKRKAYPAYQAVRQILGLHANAMSR